MKNRILVIVHLEPDFGKLIEEELPRNVALYSQLFDQTLVVESASELSGTQPYYELMHLYDRWVETWVWGWPDHLDCYDMEPEEEVIEGRDYIVCSGSAHPGAYLPDWLWELNNNDQYYLVGGCRNECLQDVAEMFNERNLDFRIVESLTF